MILKTSQKIRDRTHCRLRRATKLPLIRRSGSGRLRRALTTSIKKPKIDPEDFAEDVPYGALTKVKVKVG